MATTLVSSPLAVRHVFSGGLHGAGLSRGRPPAAVQRVQTFRSDSGYTRALVIREAQVASKDPNLLQSQT